MALNMAVLLHFARTLHLPRFKQNLQAQLLHAAQRQAGVTVHACIDLQVAVSQAVKGGQQISIASVQALVQACACCSIISAAHDCRHIPAWPVVPPKCVLRQLLLLNVEP